MIRSLLAVMTGILVLTALTFAIEAATTPVLLGSFPQSLPTREAMHSNVGVKLFILLYSTLSMVVAGYLTAAIARHHPRRHAVAMASIQVALTLWAMSRFGSHAPWWAWLAGMSLMLPAAWCGACWRCHRALSETRSPASPSEGAGAAPVDR